MLYDENLKEAMLGVLEERMLGIADSIVALVNNGYVPNKNKKILLDWASILIHAYENVDIMSEEQHNNLDIIYNKVITM